MIGIFGSSAEDRYRERELDNWLDSQDDPDFDEDEFEQRCAEADERYNSERLKD